MLTRREAVAAGAAAVLAGSAGAGGGKILRPLWRWETDRWVRRRMFELAPGDVFCLVYEPGDSGAESGLCVGPVRAVGRPRPSGAGNWGVDVRDYDGPPLTPPAPDCLPGGGRWRPCGS